MGFKSLKLRFILKRNSNHSYQLVFISTFIKTTKREGHFLSRILSKKLRIFMKKTQRKSVAYH